MRRCALMFGMLVAAGGAVSCKYLGAKIMEAIHHLDRWDNGMPKREGELLDGLQSGQWTYYYQGGKRRAQGPYADDHQVGAWTYWYESGVVEWTGSFDERGHRTGRWKFFYPDESVRAEGSYLNDFEEGEWTFLTPAGALERRGQFEAGKLSGLWTYWHPNGQKQAEGICHRGQRVGGWRLWDEQGQETAKDFGAKAGLAVVHERWPDGASKRLGVLDDGVAVGCWTCFHPNGAVRLACTFREGRVAGLFSARRPDGDVVAEGRFEDGEFAAGCCGFADGAEVEIVAGPIPHAPPAGAEWSQDSVLAAAPDVVVATWLAEARSPAEPVAVSAESEAPSASPRQIAALQAVPEREPAPLQPEFTVTQRVELKNYVLDYLDGKSKQRVSRRRYGPAGKQEADGPRRRSELEGKVLPVTLFEGVDGELVDTKDFIGKKRVLVVVLRGFAGEVCVYCVAQTEALAQCRDKFDDLNLEVLVVYPGPKGNEKAFLQAYEDTFGKGAPPYRVFYDPDLELVGALGIRGGDLAFPTTLVIDTDGIVQYAYVGEHRADRPAAKKLIELIEGISQ